MVENVGDSVYLRSTRSSAVGASRHEESNKSGDDMSRVLRRPTPTPSFMVHLCTSGIYQTKLSNIPGSFPPPSEMVSAETPDRYEHERSSWHVYKVGSVLSN